MYPWTTNTTVVTALTTKIHGRVLYRNQDQLETKIIPRSILSASWQSFALPANEPRIPDAVFMNRLTQEKSKIIKTVSQLKKKKK